MKKKSTMDTIFIDGKNVSISGLQEETKATVVKTYRQARKDKKLTQIDMSIITGIPQPNITRFESDKSNPTLEMLVKMAAALNMKVNISFEPLSDEYLKNDNLDNE